jgi:hypothetical protein
MGNFAPMVVQLQQQNPINTRLFYYRLAEPHIKQRYYKRDVSTVKCELEQLKKL